MSLALGVCVLVTGCAWSRSKLNDENLHLRAQSVREGHTTEAELVKLLGSGPNTIIPMRNGNQVYAYNVGDTKTKGLSLIVLNISKTNVRIDSAYFFINEKGIVEKSSISTNSQEVPWEWWAFD